MFAINAKEHMAKADTLGNIKHPRKHGAITAVYL